RDLRRAGPGATLAITIENPGLGGRSEPVRYQGLVELASASLAGAFEDSFRRSEQLPTRILLAAAAAAAAGQARPQTPRADGDALLRRLFHEESPKSMGGRALRFGCSCSRHRVAAVLQALGREEANAAVIEGAATIRCEFCGETWRFGQSDVDALFTGVQAP